MSETCVDPDCENVPPLGRTMCHDCAPWECIECSNDEAYAEAGYCEEHLRERVLDALADV